MRISDGTRQYSRFPHYLVYSCGFAPQCRTLGPKVLRWSTSRYFLFYLELTPDWLPGVSCWNLA